jgi:hypothetical protein
MAGVDVWAFLALPKSSASGSGAGDPLPGRLAGTDGKQARAWRATGLIDQVQHGPAASRTHRKPMT